MKRRILPVLAALLLSACATQGVQRGVAPVDPVAAEQQQAGREQRLRPATQWGFSGRVAISNGRNGGSGRIDWRRDGDALQISLSAPVTRQSWQLFAEPGGARIEGLEGGTRHGPDAATLLREATGWEIPVARLDDWLRGLRAGGLPVAALEWGEHGLLRQLQQDGWRIDYRWPETLPAGGLPMPVRIDAVNGEAKVKLLVDQWQMPETEAP